MIVMEEYGAFNYAALAKGFNLTHFAGIQSFSDWLVRPKNQNLLNTWRELDAARPS